MSNSQPNINEKPSVQPPVAPVVRKPNESGSIVVQAHMKIFDPVTRQVYVEGRA